MAGHRRDDQDFRIVAVRGDAALKPDQVAERPAPDDFFAHRNPDAADLRFLQAEFRLAVTPRRAFQNLTACGDLAAVAGMSQRIERVLEIKPRHVGDRPERCHGGVVQLVKVIERQRRISFVYEAAACPCGEICKHSCSARVLLHHLLHRNRIARPAVTRNTAICYAAGA